MYCPVRLSNSSVFSEMPLPSITTDSQRLSVASTTGTSFFTARASPSTPTPDSDSTTTPRQVQMFTLGLDSNTFHKTTVMHVISSDVAVHPTPHTHPFDPVGPPPPSPPASIKLGDELDVARLGLRPPRPVVFDPVAVERARSPPRDRTPSVDSRTLSRLPPSAFSKPSPPAHDLLHRSSTDTKLSAVSALTASTRAPRTLALSDAISEVLIEPSGYASPSGSASPPSAKHIRGHTSSLSQSQSPDGYLQPPPGGSGHARRNTTGGHIRPVRSAPQAGHGYDVDNDIEDDIQLQAEQIRRERKRAKAQKDAEEALTRSSSRRRGSLGKEDEDKVLVGNLIGEDHANYVLMYNMLTGIRIAVSVVSFCEAVAHPLSWQVSRCQAKMKEPLTDEHFTARHKYSFDMCALARSVLAIP